MKDTTETKDLYLASFWYAKGLRLVDSYFEGKECHFVFENPSLCKKLEFGYFSRTDAVVAKDFVNSIRTLKELVHRR